MHRQLCKQLLWKKKRKNGYSTTRAAVTAAMAKGITNVATKAGTRKQLSGTATVTAQSSCLLHAICGTASSSQQPASYCKADTAIANDAARESRAENKAACAANQSILFNILLN